MGYIVLYIQYVSRLAKVVLLGMICNILSLQCMYTAERRDIYVKVVEYTATHQGVDMFDIGIWQGSTDLTYMIRPQFFTKRDIYPVGIIIHNKGAVPIKISAKSICEHDIWHLLQRCLVNNSEPMIATWLTGSLGIFVTGMINILERDMIQRLWGPVTKWALLISTLATSCALYSELHEQQLCIDALSRHMLTADRIVRPGQKIITYTLFDRYQQGMDRAEFGGLSGIKLDLFDLGDQVYESFLIGEYEHAV